MTAWALTEAVPARDVLDERFPARARRRLSSLRDRAFPSLTLVASGRWRTVAIDGEASDWLEVTVESDPWVVQAAPGEAVAGAGEAIGGSGGSGAGARGRSASAAKRGAHSGTQRKRRTG